MNYYSPVNGVEVYDDCLTLAHRFDINEAVKKSNFRNLFREISVRP